MATIITAGVFDVVHFGHASLLLYCRRLAGPDGRVIVSVDSDDKVKRDKGEDRPIFSVDHRIDQIQSLVCDNRKVVDQVCMHEDNADLLRIVVLIRPDIIVVGDSYMNKPVVGSEVSKVICFPQTGISSTQIIEACQRKNS